MLTFLRSIAKSLDNLVAQPNPDLRYDMLSDALYWQDEIPNELIDISGNSAKFHPILRYRTTLILNNPDKELERHWMAAKELFPNWPGFREDRCKPNDELSIEFKKRRDCALAALDTMFD